MDIIAIGDPSDNRIMIFFSPNMLTELEAAVHTNYRVEIDSAYYDAIIDVYRAVTKSCSNHATWRAIISPNNLPHAIQPFLAWMLWG